MTHGFWFLIVKVSRNYLVRYTQQFIQWNIFSFPLYPESSPELHFFWMIRCLRNIISYHILCGLQMLLQLETLQKHEYFKFHLISSLFPIYFAKKTHHGKFLAGLWLLHYWQTTRYTIAMYLRERNGHCKVVTVCILNLIISRVTLILE